MKKYSVKLASLVVFFATNAAIGMLPLPDPSIGVHVVNKTSYTINIEATPDIMGTQIGLEMFEPKTIVSGKSMYVGQLIQIADIQTSGYHTPRWTSNEKMLKEVKEEVVRMRYTHVDVYFHVVSSMTSYYINGWHLVESIAKNEPGLLIEYISLDDIKSGYLGADYARKVTEICKANYAKAEAAGASNLCKYLEQRLKTNVLKGAPIEIKTSEDAIKNIIDGLYAKLQMYKTPMGTNRTVYIR